MELILLARAEAEILETNERLEDAVEGLGQRFCERVEEALDQLVAFPWSGPVFAAPYRRVLVRDFPFGVFYCVEPRRIVVQAVMDLRQNVEDIRRKLRLE